MAEVEEDSGEGGGMIFKPELAEKILKGEKVQTRRTRKPGEWFYNRDDGGKTVFTGTKIKWETGKCYAIQTGRGKPAIGRFRLLDIREELLQDITESGAIAEGVELNHYYCDEGIAPDFLPVHRCDPVGKFFNLWDSINKAPGFRVEDNPTVFALTFEYVGEE